MSRLFSAFIAAVLSAVFAFSGAHAQDLDPENTLYMDLKSGRVTIKLLPELAPKHVARVKELTREGFYDGLTFHRVIAGFMAQGGDPDGTGMGGSGQNLPAEFSKKPFERGVIGMARSRDINSGDSQFFIMFDRAPNLDNQYTVWGEVIDGMEHVDKIKRGRGPMGMVPAPADKIIRMQVAADAG